MTSAYMDRPSIGECAIPPIGKENLGEFATSSYKIANVYLRNCAEATQILTIQ